MKYNRRRLEVQRNKAINGFKKCVLALIVCSLLFFCFVKFEAWFNRDYYASRCAGYGYQPDCVTPLEK